MFLAASVHAVPLLAAEITLDEPAVCIVRDDLEFQVERALGQPLEAAAAAGFLVHVRAAKPGFRADLEISEDAAPAPRGFRSLSAKTCGELTQQVALAIALGGQATSETATRKAASPSPPLSPASNAPLETPPAPPTASASVELEAQHAGAALAGSAWVIGDTGTLPAMGWGTGWPPRRP